MTSLRYLFAALLVSTLLVSCGSEHIDSRHPSVSQQDAYDVSWGLPPRKARGNPKMRYQYNSRAEQAATVGAAPSAPAEVSAPAHTPSPAPAPISPTLPANSNLR